MSGCTPGRLRVQLSAEGEGCEEDLDRLAALLAHQGSCVRCLPGRDLAAVGQLLLAAVLVGMNSPSTDPNARTAVRAGLAATTMDECRAMADAARRAAARARREGYG